MAVEKTDPAVTQDQQTQAMSALESQLKVLTGQLHSAASKNQELEQLQAEQKAQSDLEALKAQADIRKVMDANADEGTDDDEIESISKKQMLDIVADAFEKSSAAKMKQFAIEVEGANQAATRRIDGLQNSLIQVIAALDVEHARSRHPDLDDYREDISAIIAKHPSLTIDNAYTLAKTAKAGGTPGREDVDSERPRSHATGIGLVDAAARAARNAERVEASIGGTGHDFKRLLADGIKKVTSKRK